MFRSLYLSLLLIVLAACSKTDIKPPPPKVDVTDYVVEPKTIPAVFDFIGFAESSHAVEIRARVEGYLDTIAYEEGQIVNEGQLLFQLDPRQYEAKVAQAKADVSKQEAILENAKLTVNRLTPLYEQKATSKKDLDNAIANQLSAEASLQASKAQLLDSKIQLDYTTIRSPVTGMADKAKFREGALISPGPDNLLTTVSVLDPMWVYFTISDNDILTVTQQQANKKLILPKDDQYKVEIILGDGNIFPYNGRVDFSSPTYDQSTGTMLVRAVFPNPKGGFYPEDYLRPGQFLRVKVYGAERPNAIFVPKRALLQKKGGMFVYLIDQDQKVIAQDVTVGEWYQDYQIITNGLKAGDRIVVDGINKIRPGTTVQVIGPWNAASDSKTPSSPQGK
ncbi:efflux RND transporter periplasmic adaptor subunit [Candidatus Protochlamydia phocaeensis]|uniref:efflux RND transporter periplasmic adaptor subunit n=1 Tax=Candidatus Protochlamydia phocaeensis TaxID=1414722 RepID=UPI0008388489|nr:efflux RND transporter periplasmic adaptor subunit [Candidatus Protochlamydia phocaeensis]